MKRGRRIPTWVFIVLALLIIALGVFLFLSDRGRWQTYRNIPTGYGIMSPREWIEEKALGEQETLLLVRKRKEVVEFERELVKAGKKAKYGIEDGGDVWLVQVYEIVEQGGEGHTATFNWYRVDKKTGNVTTEFEGNGKP